MTSFLVLDAQDLKPKNSESSVKVYATYRPVQQLIRSYDFKRELYHFDSVEVYRVVDSERLHVAINK